MGNNLALSLKGSLTIPESGMSKGEMVAEQTL